MQRKLQLTKQDIDSLECIVLLHGTSHSLMAETKSIFSREKKTGPGERFTKITPSMKSANAGSSFPST
jgi:hypothetical protein